MSEGFDKSIYALGNEAIQLAKAQLAQRSPKNALTILEAHIENDKNDAFVFFEAARIALTLQDAAKAREYLRCFHGLKRPDTYSMELLADINLAENKRREAADAFQHALRLIKKHRNNYRPGHTGRNREDIVLKKLGAAFLSRGKFEDGLRTLNELVALYPDAEDGLCLKDIYPVLQSPAP